MESCASSREYVEYSNKERSLLCFFYVAFLGIIQGFLQVVPLIFFLEIHSAASLPFAYLIFAFLSSVTTLSLFCLKDKLSVFLTLKSSLGLMLFFTLALNLGFSREGSFPYFLLGAAYWITWSIQAQFWIFVNRFLPLVNDALLKKMEAIFTTSTVLALISILPLSSFFSLHLLLWLVPFLFAACLFFIFDSDQDLLTLKRKEGEKKDPFSFFVRERSLAEETSQKEEKRIEHDFFEELNHNGISPSIGLDFFKESTKFFLSPFFKKSHHYIFGLLSLAFLAAVSFYFIDIAFLGTAQSYFSTSESLLYFLVPIFIGLHLVPLLLSQIFSYARLKNFGIIDSAICYPIILLIGIGIAFLNYGEPNTWLFLASVILLRFVSEFFVYTILETVKIFLFQFVTPIHRIWLAFLEETFLIPKAIIVVSLVILAINVFMGFSVFYILIPLGIANLLLLLDLCILKRSFLHLLKYTFAHKYFSSHVPYFWDRIGLDFLKSKLQGVNPDEAIYSLDILEKSETPILSEALSKAVNHPSPEVKKHVLELIYRHELEEFYPLVAFLCQDPLQNIEVRVKAVSIFPTLISSFQSGDSYRWEAITELLKTSSTKLRSATIVSLLNQNDPILQEPAAQSLQILASSKDPQQRLQAAIILGQVPHLENSVFVKRFLSDVDPRVRSAAAIAIATLPHSAFYGELLTYLNGMPKDELLTEEGEQGADFLLPFLISEYFRGSFEVKIKVLQLMGNLSFSIKNELLIYAFLMRQLNSKTSEIHQLAKNLLNKFHFHKTDISEKKTKENWLFSLKNNVERLFIYEDFCRKLPETEHFKFLADLLRAELMKAREQLNFLLALRFCDDTVKHLMEKLSAKSPLARRGLLKSFFERKNASKVSILAELFVSSGPKEEELQGFEKVDELLEEIAIDYPRQFFIGSRAAALYAISKTSLPLSRNLVRVLTGERSPLIQETLNWALRREV